VWAHLAEHEYGLFHEVRSRYLHHLHLSTNRLEFIDYLCEWGGMEWAMTYMIKIEGAVLPGKPVEDINMKK
jgi:hypothetical protein